MKKEKVMKKLAAVKNLAERGVGGEKETALQLYEELKQKYGISEADIETAEIVLNETKKIEHSDVMFLLWVIVNNLAEEKALCRECMAGDCCLSCSTHENIKDLEKQYEDLKRQLE